MSFTEEIKKELLSCELPKGLRTAFTYGFLYGFRGSKQRLVTSNADIIECAENILPKGSFWVERVASAKKTNFILNLQSEELLKKYEPFSAQVSKTFVSGSDETTGAFLRGVFMTCGSVYIQKAGYHLELSPEDDEKCERLFGLINEQGMKIDISARKKHSFLYSKNSENISDFLTFIGAMQSSMKIMNIKIYKEIRSGINRAVNCETANMDKTAAAAAKQILDIRLIESAEGLEALPDELRQTALLRLENPDMPLGGLGKLFDPPVSRSGVDHRLRRISAKADEIRNKQS